MAVILYLTDGTTTVNFNTTTSHQALSNWEPVIATPRGDGMTPDYVVDVLPIYTYITGDDAFAALLKAIHLLQCRAAEYWADPAQATPVWFHRKLNNETGEHQTLVRSIAIDSDAQFGSWIDSCPSITSGRTHSIAIEHHPYWEDTASSGSGSTNFSVLGGQINYGSPAGNAPARIRYLRLYGGDAAAEFNYYWIGFRSDGRAAGDAANYYARWEAEWGTVIANTSLSTVADSSPGGANNAFQTNLAAAWTANWSLTLDQIIAGQGAGNVSAYRGAFVVLARAKVDAGTAQVKLELRGADTNTSVMGPVVNVAATSYTMYNLGPVFLPLRNLKALPTSLFPASYDGSTTFRLWSRNKSGASSLVVDCLVGIPHDEYFLHIENAGVTSNHECYIGVSPAGIYEAVNVNLSTNRIAETCIVSSNGDGIPVGDGRLFMCIANANHAAPAYNDDHDTQWRWYPRYYSLKGGD